MASSDEGIERSTVNLMQHFDFELQRSLHENDSPSTFLASAVFRHHHSLIFLVKSRDTLWSPRVWFKSLLETVMPHGGIFSEVLPCFTTTTRLHALLMLFLPILCHTSSRRCNSCTSSSAELRQRCHSGRDWCDPSGLLHVLWAHIQIEFIYQIGYVLGASRISYVVNNFHTDSIDFNPPGTNLTPMLPILACSFPPVIDVHGVFYPTRTSESSGWSS